MLLLNIGPKPDGTTPEPDRRLLEELGAWMLPQVLYTVRGIPTPL